MKRDMDLIRELLLEIEEKHDGSGYQVNLDYTNYPKKTEDEILYHLVLLNEVGFIECANDFRQNGIIRNLHWAGHDFLDSIRDDKIWAQTKEGASSAGGFTVDILRDLAKGLIKTQIKKATGIEL